MSGRSGWFAGFAKSRIYINAYALVINQLTSAGLGFLYWMLAARLYGVEVVGASSAAISTLLLVSGVAQLGLGVGMHRFIPRAGRHTRKLIVSAYVVTIVASGVLGLVALWILRVAKAGTLPSVSYIPPSLAVVATVLWSVFSFQDGVLIGLRKSVWVLVENLTYNIAKIVLLVAGAWVLHDAGIVGSWFIPTPFVVALVTWVVFGNCCARQRPNRATRQTCPPCARSRSLSLETTQARWLPKPRFARFLSRWWLCWGRLRTRTSTRHGWSRRLSRSSPAAWRTPSVPRRRAIGAISEPTAGASCATWRSS